MPIPRSSRRSANWRFLGPRDLGPEPERRRMGRLLTDVQLFSREVIERPLYPYQLEPARAILDSVLHHRGFTFTVMMSRQAGKNELSAQIEAFLLVLFQRIDCSIVKAAPTFNPQLYTSIARLERCLDNPLTRGRWSRRLGALQLRRARILFLSGAPESNVLGATASLLLEIDEAQSFDEDKYSRDFRPMCAATNATTVLYGTAWTSDTPLEHARLENRRLETIDGIQRNFFYPWAVVAEHNAAYRDFVQADVLRKGADHPHIRTQYFLESLTSAGKLFSDTQLAQLASAGTSASPPDPSHASSARPTPVPAGAQRSERQPTDTVQVPESARLADLPSSGGLGGRAPHEKWGGSRWPGVRLGLPLPLLVAGIDIAGEDEEAEDSLLRSLHPQRDSTAVAIAQVTWKTTLGVTEPHIEVIHFEWWTGRKHSEITPQLVDLLKNVWPCQAISVDKTGIGAGIASFLVNALGADLVHPFSFSAVSKSDLGYQLLSAVNTGRLKIPGTADLVRGPPSPGGLGGLPPEVFSIPPAPAHGGGGEGAPLNEFWNQARLARSDFHANQRLSWYVDPREGHDDLLVAVALAVEAAQHSRPRIATGRMVRR